VNVLEIILHRIGKPALRSGRGSAGNHLDKSIRMGVD
jgi:hypothetical protein